MGAHYSDRQKAQIRDAWISGQYGSVIGLATAFGVRREVIYSWRRADRWDDDRAKINAETAQIATAAIVSEISAAREKHFELWGRFDSEIEHRLQRFADKGEEVPLEELETMAKILERAQRGRYFALGDKVEIEETEVRTEIIYSGLEESIAAARKAGDGSLPSPVPVRILGDNGDEPPADRIPLLETDED